ncbi:YciI family protein [Streptosporangium sp. NPDC050855]|uniref:YciI family protein n=1 Tax=Streptosporangium sp. NPDC050855 TaxID=3366194 RepID=UPI0037B20B66
MKFALLLFDPGNHWDSISQEETGAALAEHEAFARYLRERGTAFSGEALEPAKEARSLRPSGRKPVVADGPFVPLRQEPAGHHLIGCADLDEAEEIARHCPLGAGIEIRPVRESPS